MVALRWPWLANAAILGLAVACLCASVAGEYHVQKFLNDREAYLSAMIDVPPPDKIDAAIEKFALKPGTTTVRMAPWEECKRQFVLHHERVVRNDHPLHFRSYCPRTVEDRKRLNERTNKKKKKKGGQADDDDSEVDDGPKVVKPGPRNANSPPVRISFTLFVNPNDPIWRIHRVMNAIYSKQDFYFVHIDASPQYRDVKEMEDDRPSREAAVKHIFEVMQPFIDNGNVRVEDVFDVSWGGISMMNAELAMAEALLQMGEWDYWINLSSTDYPLKSIEEFRKYLALEQNWGKNFGHGFKSDMRDTDKNAGMMRTYVECAGHSYRVDDLMLLPTGLEIWGASSWYVLHRSFVQWVDDCMARGWDKRKEGQCSVVLDFLDYSQYRVNFEEQYLQTVQMNTEWCDMYKNDDMRYVDWSKDWDGCEHWEEVDGCGSSPQVITFKSWEKAHRIPSKFFARKFENPVDFDKMDHKLGINTTATMSEFVRQKEYDTRHKKSDQPDLPNVALNKKAVAATTQWSEQGTYKAGHLVDGKMKTRWSSEHFEPQWMQIHLSTPDEPICDVQEVHVTWETAYAAAYKLMVSHDMEDWEIVYIANQTNHPRPRKKSDLTHMIKLGDKGKRIKGLKVHCNERGTSWGISCWEIKAFGTCDKKKGEL